MSTHPLEEILHPQSIAVVGASGDSGSRWRGDFVTPLLELGFKGKIYPVNPKYPEIHGLKAYPSIRDIPGPVDYVISSVPARQVLTILEDCSYKRVKAAHLFTARFSETGRQEAAELEREVLKQARKGDIRLIGPNCMGVYYPRHGISWSEGLPKESGGAGLASQSGNVAGDIVQIASLRGVYFSKAISYGNALDLTESDFLDYLSQDQETKIIMMYIEGVKDGRRFFDTLRRTTRIKPVIITKGGRGESGTRAVTSHTASLAGSMKIWDTAIAQAGAIPAENFEEMIDLATAFNFLPPIRGRRVGVVGGGGGAGVLSADQCEEAGLDVIPLPTEIREELRRQGNSIWDWIGNPTDSSISGETAFSAGDMLQMMDRNQNFDILIGIMGEGTPAGKEAILARRRGDVKSYVKVKKKISKPLLVMVEEKSLGTKDYNNWRWRVMSEARAKLIASGIPTYPTMARTASTARKLVEYYQRRK